ncbi:toxin-antitoxin system HicB family antitoxin, partial [Campylobacter jejuni]|nr:toxin-antitoxin system HicB family antitoxin [Campylobacter jejuni]
EKAGVSLNQYIMYLFIDDIKEKCNYFYFSHF